MLYGCATWTQKKADNKRIEAAEIYGSTVAYWESAGKTRKQILINSRWTKNRKKAIVSSVQEIVKVCKTCYKKWKTNLIKIAFQGKTVGKGKRGRQTASRVNNIKEASGCRQHEVSRRCLDREQRIRKCLAMCPIEAAKLILVMPTGDN